MHTCVEQRSIGGDIPLMAAAYIIMIGYTCIVMGRCDAVHSRVWVGVGAVFAVVMSTVAGYGAALYFGVPFSPLAQMLPFILIGIGGACTHTALRLWCNAGLC